MGAFGGDLVREHMLLVWTRANEGPLAALRRRQALLFERALQHASTAAFERDQAKRILASRDEDNGGGCGRGAGAARARKGGPAVSAAAHTTGGKLVQLGRPPSRADLRAHT